MNYRVIPPSEKLAQIVRYFWVLEGDASPSSPYVIRTIANSCPELLFHYRGVFDELVAGARQGSFQSGIHAQTNRYRRFDMQQPFGMFGVYLYPYALPLLFNMPAAEFTNQLPDLASVLRGTDEGLEEKMMMASNTTERVGIITRFLEQRLGIVQRPEIMFAVKQILGAGGQVNLQQLSDNCHLSTRQFERKFKEHTGFSPKTFSRVVRFNAVMGQQKTENSLLSDLAYDYGYYDQSHFIQDFKQFSGYSPSAYYSGKARELYYQG